MSIKHMGPEELKERLAKEDILLLDVREPHEAEFCAIEGSVNLPLRQIKEAADQFETEKPVVVYCHHGPRSMMAAGVLHSMGFDDVTNLDGGIDAWSLQVDPAVPRY